MNVCSSIYFFVQTVFSQNSEKMLIKLLEHEKMLGMLQKQVGFKFRISIDGVDEHMCVIYCTAVWDIGSSLRWC
jgi:hypothetical protein